MKPNGSKTWYMKYRIDGKEKKLAFGPYPMFPCLRHASSAMRHAVKCVRGRSLR
nr:Arm DNA-binding domain-containing protein [Salmonella enterica]